MSQDDIKINASEETSLLPLTSTHDTRKVVMISASLVLATGLAALLFNLVHQMLGRSILSVAMALVGVSIVLAYFNYLKPASIITTTSAFLVLTFFLYEGDGVHDASITAYSAIVILSGLLLGEIGVVVFGSLTTLSLVVLVYAEYLGFLPNKYSGLFDLIDINSIWFFHLATSVIIYFLVRRLSRIADEAQEGEKAFARANEELFSLRDVLQDRVEQRTAILEQQNSSLQAAARVAHDILAAEDVTQLLEMSTELIAKEFSYDHVGIFLINEKKDRVILRAASSAGGKKMLGEHYELSTQKTSVVGGAALDKRPRIALNQGPDADLFVNPDLPDMQSEMTLPLIIQDDILGVLDIQSRQSEAFNQNNIAIFQSLTNQLALTIQNTRLIEESQINLAQLELIISEQSSEAWSQYLDKQSHGFVYTPLGVKTLRTANLDEGRRAGLETADVPISLRGQKIGSISLQRLSRHWSKKEKALLADVANQIGLAIENARLLNETREQAHQDQLVAEVSSKMRETLDMDTVLKTALEEMKKTFHLKEVEVRLAPTNSQETES